MPTTDSPLRYPGGKTKFYPTVKNIIKKNYPKSDCVYIEPFAGGAGLALKLLLNHDVNRIVLNDIDPGIFLFWHSILNRTDDFCALIENCKIDLDTWDYQKDIYAHKDLYDELQIGFSAFYLNRCNVSGIIQGGPIGGREQTGTYLIDARFNKKALIEKIEIISALKSYIQIYNKDAKQFLVSSDINIDFLHAFFNIDPPYVNKGPILYENSFSIKDHEDLSSTVKELPYKWIVTYDDSEIIRQLYTGFRMNNFNLQYSAGKAKLGTELAVYSHSLDI